MKNIRIISLLALAFLLIQVSHANGQTIYKTESGISYRTDDKSDSYADSMCKLDIYYPVGVKQPPIVVWFHGGGLSTGHREIPQALRNQGFAVIGVGYRLVPRVNSGQCVDDAAAAVAWIYNNIDNYCGLGSTSRIYVTGHSAGGYLTLMVGLDQSLLQKYGVDANKLAGLIPYSAQVITHFATRKERGIADTQAIIDKFAPIYHVRADAPPMAIITGDRELEMLGRYEENAYFWRMLQLVGHKSSKLYELDGFDHGGMAAPAHYIAIKYIKNHQN